MVFPRTFSPVEWRRLLLLVAAVQLASAFLFLITVRRPVFDEGAYESDTGRYEREGITAAAIRAHTSPAGPGMPSLASLGGRLFPGSIVARRIPVFMTWLFAVAVLVALSRQRAGDAVVPIAGAILLAYPHSPLTMATMLSEGPSAACALAALWASGLAEADGNRTIPLYRILLAGLCVGLALWFRQYYLALAPAFVVAWWRDPARLRKWAAFAVGPLVAVGAYLFLWGGLTSPAARAGLTYGANVRAAVGLNLLRPFSALAYAGAYALPLLPWGDRQRLPRQTVVKILAAGFGAALAIVASGRSVWGNGPIMTLINATRRVHPSVQLVADLAVTGAAFAGVLTVAWLAWTSRDGGGFEPFVLLCVGVVAFFSLEQIGIDGSIPFYERYAHQAIFFSSALTLLLARPRTGRVLAFIVILVLVSQVTLWGKAS